MPLKYSIEKYPKITVVMPVLNRSNTIEKALKSVAQQDYPNLEFFVLDAASTDGTVEIIKKYDYLISYFRSHKDNGNTEAMVEGYDRASGDIVCQLNADDYYELGTLVKVGEAFIENPDVEMVNVLGRTITITADGREVVGHECTPEIMHISRGNVQAIHPTCRFFRKELFEKYGKIIGNINGKMALFSDYEYIMRFSLYNIKNITLPFFGYTFLAHEESLTFNTNKYTKLKMYDEKVFYIEELFRKCADVMDDVVRGQLNKEYRKAFPRRVVKNFVDRNYLEGWKNLKLGIDKFGAIFLWRVVSFWVSYIFRFNKIIKKVKNYVKSLYQPDSK